jgi:hypothetical protein
VIRKPENPRNRKAWPLLPKLARRKKGQHSPTLKSTNHTEAQNRKPAR